jgi:hypothetical protein
MLSPQALAIYLIAALTYFVGEEAVKGVKWVGHEVKRGGTAVVHFLKKIPHPHDDPKESPNVREVW